MLELKNSCTVAHEPNTLVFIFLTRQTCEMGIDRFNSKVAVKQNVLGSTPDFLPLNKCFTTLELTPNKAASPSLKSKFRQTLFFRAFFTRAMWCAQTIKPKIPIEIIGRGQSIYNYTLPSEPYVTVSRHTALQQKLFEIFFFKRFFPFLKKFYLYIAQFFESHPLTTSRYGKINDAFYIKV